VFQALRRWVNDETAELESALAFLPRALEPGGVLVTIAYHSGEDRIIKRSLRAPASRGRRDPEPPAPATWDVLTRRVVRPSAAEVQANPRARSARLRAARRRSA
jgi:16S rRNA (cytosine1402-N4)-methyltransferase